MRKQILDEERTLKPAARRGRAPGAVPPHRGACRATTWACSRSTPARRDRARSDPAGARRRAEGAAVTFDAAAPILCVICPPAFRACAGSAERIWASSTPSSAPGPQAKPEDDTRLRIFFVLAAVRRRLPDPGAGRDPRGAVLAVGRRAASRAGADRRARRPDRPQRPAAGGRPVHYGLYFDPHEIWDRRRGAPRAAGGACPPSAAERLDRALNGEQRHYLIGGLTPEEQRPHPRPGPAGRRPSRRRTGASIRWAPTAGHLIGFADSGGVGLAGAERALDAADPRRRPARRAGARSRSTCGSRPRCEDELDKAAQAFSRPSGAVGIVINVRTGEILGMASYPDLRPERCRRRRPTPAMINHAAATVYEPGSVFKVFTLAMGIDSGVGHAQHHVRRRARRWCSAARPSTTTTRATRCCRCGRSSPTPRTSAPARLGLRSGRDQHGALFRQLRPVRRRAQRAGGIARARSRRGLSDNTVASMSFGQSISVTPLAARHRHERDPERRDLCPLTIRKLDARRRSRRAGG